MIVFVRPQIDLRAAPEAGVLEGVAERADLQPPRPLWTEPSDKVGRRRELAGERVAKRLQIPEDRGVSVSRERADKWDEKQPEQPAVEPFVLDPRLVPLRELVTVREREEETGHVRRGVALGVGVVDGDVLAVEGLSQPQPYVPSLAVLAVEVVIVE